MNTNSRSPRRVAGASVAVLLLALGACQKKTEPPPVAATAADPQSSAASTPATQATREGDDDHGEGPEVGRRMREQHAPGAGPGGASTPSDRPADDRR